MSELKCPRCSVGIELGQTFCAKCGLALTSNSKDGGWFMKTLKVAGIAFFILIIVPQVIGSYVQYQERGAAARGQGGSAVSSAAAAEDAAVDVKASQLAAAYERNGVSADGQFKGRSLRVTGSVTAVGTDVFNHAVVTLEGNVNPFLQPSAVLVESERSRAGSLNVGQTVILVCTGAGDVIKAPMLKDCTFSR